MIIWNDYEDFGCREKENDVDNLHCQTNIQKPDEIQKFNRIGNNINLIIIIVIICHNSSLFISFYVSYYLYKASKCSFKIYIHQYQEKISFYKSLNFLSIFLSFSPKPRMFPLDFYLRAKKFKFLIKLVILLWHTNINNSILDQIICKIIFSLIFILGEMTSTKLSSVLLLCCCMIWR